MPPPFMCQYDPTKLINLGANRWAFKPELGLSRRWGHWVLDAYGGVWFFTENPEFFSRNAYVPGVQTQTQDPAVVLETHLSYAQGAYIRFGGNYEVLSAAWQCSWISGASMPSAARTSGHSSSRQE